MNKRIYGMSSLQHKIGAVFLLFFVVMALGLTVQGNLSQHLIVHPLWQELLESSTARMLADGKPTPGADQPPTGLIRGWRLGDGPFPADMPAYFARLQPGYYDEEQMDS